MLQFDYNCTFLGILPDFGQKKTKNKSNLLLVFMQANPDNRSHRPFRFTTNTVNNITTYSKLVNTMNFESPFIFYYLPMSFDRAS